MKHEAWKRKVLKMLGRLDEEQLQLLIQLAHDVLVTGRMLKKWQERLSTEEQ